MNFKTLPLLELIFCFGLLHLACNRLEPTDPTSTFSHIRNSAHLNYPLIPLSIGNEWIYEDSVIIPSKFSTKTYTLSIVGYNIDSMGIWWTFKSDIAGHLTFSKLLERNDSVYSSSMDLQYIPLNDQNTASWQIWVGGDVVHYMYVLRQQTPYITGAGTFDSCILYQNNFSDQENYTYIKSYLGIVGYEFKMHLLNFEGTSKISGRLISYHLNKQDSTNPGANKNSFFPLVIGNSWTYAETLSVTETIETRSYSLSVKNKLDNSFGTWWSINGYLEGAVYFGELMERNDSIYTLKQLSGKQNKLNLEFYNPQINDTEQFLSIYTGEPSFSELSITKTIFYLNSNFITPAGDFSKCISVFWQDGTTFRKLIIKPQVGIVGYENHYGPQPGYDYDLIYRGRLKTYHFNTSRR